MPQNNIMARPQTFESQSVLDKAVQLFWKKGYHDASAQDMVDALGLNRSSIYNTFSDKKTLFKKALCHYRDQESAGLMAILKTNEPTMDTLRGLLHHVAFAAIEGQTCRGCFIVNSAVELGQHDTDVRQIILENIEEVVAVFENFIKMGQESGHFNTRNPARNLAIFLFHNMTALRVTTKVTEDRVFLTAHIELVLQHFSR